MKKAAVLIAVVILSVFCSAPVSADEDVPAEKTIGVFAKSVYTLPDGCYGAKEEDGSDSVVELPDGVKIAFTAKSTAPSLRMVIVPITEQDAQAYAWISACAADFGAEHLFYDIYFIDEYGNRVDAHMPTEVSVALMNGCGTLKAAGISTDGSLSQLVSKSGGYNVSFTIEKGGYYVVASEKTGTPVVPKTGDNRRMEPWVALLVVSGIGVAGTVMYGRKKKRFANPMG